MAGYAAAGATSPNTSRTISAATTNATLVKGSPVDLRGYTFSNQHATLWRWVKLYNKATAPTPGGDTTLLVLTIGLPPMSAGHINLVDATGEGILFGTGLGLTMTADEEDADTTAVGAGDVVLNLLYA
jgi:hypothetical protein